MQGAFIRSFMVLLLLWNDISRVKTCSCFICTMTQPDGTLRCQITVVDPEVLDGRGVNDWGTIGVTPSWLGVGPGTMGGSPLWIHHCQVVLLLLWNYISQVISAWLNGTLDCGMVFVVW